MRARRIEELEAEVAMKDRRYEEMDARHRRQFNEMKKMMDDKLNDAIRMYDQCHEANMNLDNLLLEANVAQKEAEEKFEKIREAFAILGIAKEV